VEVDIDKLPEKEKIKVLNQRKRDADRAKAKTDREALRAKEKAERDAKKGGRAGKSKAVVASTPSLVLPQVSTASQSQNPRKRDSSYAQLSLSRLQQITLPALMDSAGEVCMYKNSSSPDPFCPLMHTMCNTRLSPRNGWI
jgi:chemotaxis protein histidine kinase CheA